LRCCSAAARTKPRNSRVGKHLARRTWPGPGRCWSRHRQARLIAARNSHQAAQNDLLKPRQQFVTPFERRAQGLMSRHGGPATTDEQVQAPIQPAGHPSNAQQIHVPRSQFDRQRVPVEPPANPRDEGHFGIVELEGVRAFPGSLPAFGRTASGRGDSNATISCFRAPWPAQRRM
jgi:hypothetical protein